MNVEKCRYSIDGKCANENVACDVCHSTDVEMRSCIPLQRCVLLYNDNWMIKTEEAIDVNKNVIRTCCGKA